MLAKSHVYENYYIKNLQLLIFLLKIVQTYTLPLKNNKQNGNVHKMLLILHKIVIDKIKKNIFITFLEHRDKVSEIL